MTRTGGMRGTRWVLLALLGAAIALLIWGALSARTVAVSADAAQEDLERLEQALRGEPGGAFAPDVAAAREALAGADIHAARADGAARSLPLALAGYLPVVGDDVRAVRDLARATHIVTADVLPPLLDAAGGLDPQALAGPDGALDLQLLRDAAPAARLAATSGEQVATLVRPVDPDRLLGALQDPARKARAGLIQVAEMSRSLGDALTVLPEALGAHEPKQYLLAFQNLAEARPTGGIVGAWALLEADAGRLRLVESGVNDDLEKLVGPVRDLGEEVRALYGADLRRSQNVNLSPHFPHAAVLLSDLWVQQGRPAPDGVIAVDPIALADLLEATGPVAVPGGPTISAETVVDVVQAEAYEIFQEDRGGRLDYLSAVPAAVFDAVLDAGLADPRVLDAVVSAARDRHLQIWSADEETQAVVEDVGVAGALPPPTEDVVRVHITNIDASKLDHYLDVDVSCTPGAVVVGLTSDVPDTVPPYVANHLPGADPRSHRIVLDMLLPPQRGVGSLEVDGEQTNLATGSLLGWTVARAVLDLPPGEHVEARWELLGRESAPSPVVQHMTRGIEVTGCDPSSER